MSPVKHSTQVKTEFLMAMFTGKKAEKKHDFLMENCIGCAE